MAMTTVYGDENPAKDSDYTVRIAVTYDPNSTAVEQVCSLQMQLRRKSSVTRKRHAWELHYYVDSTDSPKHSAPYTLPDDNAQTGVVLAGQLKMVGGQWYNWGPVYKYTVKNDGAKHRFDVSFSLGTSPFSGASGKFITFPKYQVKVNPPQNVRVSFNPDTRELSYTWDDVSGAYIKLWRNWFVEGEKDPVVEGWFYVNGSNELSNANKPLKEILRKDVTYVTYEVVNVSSTGYTASNGGQRFDLPTDDKVWVYINGAWKKAIPWVNVDGVWKKVTKVYVNVNGTWKRTIK